jgi:drug/metabolite transporter (DMT)-like permease
LQRTTPTRVTISVTINPIVSAISGAYVLDEPVTVNLVLALLLVATGILVASVTPRRRRSGWSDAIKASN